MSSPTVQHDVSEKRLAISKTLREALSEMQDIADLLFAWNWTDTTGGSMSIRLPQAPDLFAMTPTHSGFKRWKLLDTGLVVLDRILNMTEFSTATARSHPSALTHQGIYENFKDVNAVIHVHAPYSLVFASADKTIYPLTQQARTLGEVPCLKTDVDRLKNRNIAVIDTVEKVFTSGVEGYDRAKSHFEDFLPAMLEYFKPREHELKSHGLAFTAYKHGIFVMARNLSEAFDNLIRVERNAQVQLLSNNLPDQEFEDAIKSSMS